LVGDEMPTLPCVLCGKNQDQRIDKNNKPYFICDPCGTQFFVRRRQGIEKLEQLFREFKNRNFAFTRNAQSLYEVQAILREIDGLKFEIEKLDGQIGIIFVDEDKVRARNLLKKRVQGLLLELEKIAKRNSEIR
jgi:chaperonin cofactor prefoldin